MQQKKQTPETPKIWIVSLDEETCKPYSLDLNLKVGSKFKSEDTGLIYQIVSESVNKFYEVNFLYAKIIGFEN
jgi:hypothetical protein